MADASLAQAPPRAAVLPGAAGRLRTPTLAQVWLGLAGLASVIFGAVLLTRPGVGALAVVWLIGAYSILTGVLLVALGFHVKGRLAQFA